MAHPFEKILEELLLTSYILERNVKEILKSLLKIITREYRRELLEVYPYLPETTKVLIMKYLRNVETGSVGEAELEVDKEVETLFNKLYDLLRRLSQLVRGR